MSQLRGARWEAATRFGTTIPDDRFDIVVDTGGVAARVRAGLLGHRTQWDDLNNQSVIEQE